MMEQVQSWLMSLVAVSLLAALVRGLVGGGSLRRVADFLCALALLTVLLAPLPGMRPERLLPDSGDCRRDTERLQRQLEEAQQEALEQDIAERTAAYISDKAGCAARVEVKEERGLPLPWRVEVARTYDGELAAWIAETVGIPQERQEWQDAEH